MSELRTSSAQNCEKSSRVPQNQTCQKRVLIYNLSNFKTFFVVKIGPDMNFVAFVTGSDLLSRSVARQTSCGIIVCLFGLF